MTKRIDAREFGLTSRTHLEQNGTDHLILVINRKSRLIMADGNRIAQTADTIRTIKPAYKISLRTTAPICSKTQRFLSEIGIEII